MYVIHLQISKVTSLNVAKSDSHSWIILRFSCTKRIGKHSDYVKKKTKFKQTSKFCALTPDHKCVKIVFYFHTTKSVKEWNHQKYVFNWLLKNWNICL